MKVTLVCGLAVLIGCGTSTTTPDGGSDGGSDAVAVETGSDAPTDVGSDAPDPCASAPTTTFYVNATTGNDSNSGAGPNCAVKTISAGLAASSTSAHDNATIHVAAGSYGTGENFPLILNHGRSLVGAGASSTTIQGSSAPYNTSMTASFLDTGMHYVTILAGDTMGVSTISGFTILPQASLTMPTTNYVGLACIAGNGPNTGASLPLPAPNLVLTGLTVGPYFDLGVAIGSEPTNMTACNVAITTSTITGDNVGVATGVCGAANPMTSWPSAQVGDGMMADANTFTNSAIDIFGEGCGSIQSFNGNKLTSGYRGIVLVSSGAQYFEILANTFDGTAGPLTMGIGVNTSAQAVINKLNDNTFANISESSGADTSAGGTTGYALALGGARVIQANRNNINNNDNGILLGSGALTNFDFSSDGMTANANQIYCNSKPSTATTNGYDLIVPSAETLNFSGNIWDHATPTTGVSTSTSANGTDVVGITAGINLTGSTATTHMCNGTRVH